MGRFFTIALALILIFTNKIALSSVSYGQIKEFLLEEQIKSENPIIHKNKDYQYIANNLSLIINIKNKDLKSVVINNTEISDDNLIFKVAPAKEWRFSYGYKQISGTYNLHMNRVFLPDCFNGNICSPNNSFSISFPELSDNEEINFYLNGRNVTTLFYYNTEKNTYKIKEHNERSFFDLFNTSVATLTWKSSSKKLKDGEIKIFVSKNIIEGDIRDETNTLPLYLTGREVRLDYTGSETLAPHSIYGIIENDGTFTFNNLPTLDYIITLPDLPYITPNIEDLIITDINTTLKTSIIVPHYNKIITLPVSEVGDNVILDKTYFKNIKKLTSVSFKKLFGDQLLFKINNDNISILVLSNRIGQINFEAKVGKELWLIILPVKKNNTNTYIPFALFSGDGLYSKTSLNMSNNNVFIPNSTYIKFTFDSVLPMNPQTSRVYYHNEDNKEYDITKMFTFIPKSNELVFNNKYNDQLNNIITSDGIISGELCAEGVNLNCNGIKQKIKLASSNIIVNTTNPDRNIFIVLKEITPDDNNVIIVKSLSDKKIVLENIPKGIYQLQLINLAKYSKKLKIIKVINNDNIYIDTLDFYDDLSDSIISSDNLYYTNETIVIGKNDSKIIDLKSINPPVLDIVSKVDVIGKFKGILKLYPDNTLYIKSSDSLESSNTYLFLTARDKRYILPLSYIGSDISYIKEKGSDYGMCLKIDYNCINAYIEVKGVDQGVYNGKSPIEIILPFPFNDENLNISLDNKIYIKDMFTIDNNRIVLKESSIPSFLSLISHEKKPITLDIENRKYTISIVPGYKTVEFKAVDDTSADFLEGDGSIVRLSCIYDNNRFFSTTQVVNGTKIIFQDLPDCNYNIELVDQERIYSVEIDEITLNSGNNDFKSLLQFNCLRKDVTTKKCMATIPTINGTVITPHIGIINLDTNNPKNIEIKPKNELHYIVFGNKIYAYDYSSKSITREIRFTDDDSKKTKTIMYNTIPVKSFLINESRSNPKSEIKLANINSLTYPMTYTGKQFSISFNNADDLKLNNFNIKLYVDNVEHDIRDIFYWSDQHKSLILKKSYYSHFFDLLTPSDNTIQISIDDTYNLDFKIFKADSDIIITFSTDFIGRVDIKSPILIISGQNDNIYKKITIPKLQDELIIKDIPSGMYDILFFDYITGLHGAKELEIPENGAYMYIDIPLKKIKQNN